MQAWLAFAWRPVPVRPIAGWATATMYLVGGFALINLLDTVNPLVEMWAVGQAATTGGGTPAAVAVLARVVTGALAVILYALAAVSWLTWLSRCRRNLDAFADAHPSWSAGLAVGVWFIPLVNLVGPVFAVADLVRNSVPAQRRGRLIAAVWAWWVLFVGGWAALAVGGYAGYDSLREMSRLRAQLADGETVDQALAAELLGNEIAARLPSAGLLLAAAAVLIVLVGRVTEAQYARLDAYRAWLAGQPEAPTNATIGG